MSDLPRPDQPRDVEVAVIGAGQAGLAAAYFLRHRGVTADDFVVLDANDRPGGAWLHRWPGLTMEYVHGVHQLPGMEFDDTSPTEPANEAVPRYFAEYERRFELPVRRPVSVYRVEEAPDDRLDVHTDVGTWRARALVNATGTWTKPFWPRYPGSERFRGRQLHSADYRGPDEFVGKHVVVVGGGHSAMQHLAELATVTTTTWVTRHPPRWRTSPFDDEGRRAAVAMVEEAVTEGRRPPSVVSVTGLVRTATVEQADRLGALVRHAMFDTITEDGVTWDDGRTVLADVILWATGFRHALDHLAPLALRGRAGGIRMEGTAVAGDSRIHLLGYGPSASTIGANRAARAAVRELRTFLGRDAAIAAH